MAIIKYRVEAQITRTGQSTDNNVMASVWQYEEVYNPFNPGKILTREQAKNMIDEMGLVKVHQNEHGVIWDEPDEPMLKKYGNTFSFKF